VIKKIFGIRKIFYIPILIALLFGYSAAAISEDIEVKHVYKIFPAFIVYTDNLDPRFTGLTHSMVVFIDKEMRNDTRVLTHELVHVRQGYRTLFMYSFLIPFDDTILVKMECEAYATEIKSKYTIPWFVMFIQDEYKTSMTAQEIHDYILFCWERQHS
jgi:hypothetical protein